MDVKDVQEDADAEAAAEIGFDPFGFGDEAVGGGDDEAFALGDGAVGIAEEPEENAASSRGSRMSQREPVVNQRIAATAMNPRP